MAMMINFKNVIKKLHKLKVKDSNKFFQKKKLFIDLINNNYVKKKNDNLDSYQVRKNIKNNLLPNIHQLYFIYNLITIFRRITVLEFGVGWSTIAISKALLENKQKYSNKIKNLRFNDPFHLFTLDNYLKFIKQTKSKLDREQKKITSFCFSKVKTVEFEKRICTEYEKLPRTNPDFIFIDGPSQFNVDGKVNNFNTAHPDLAPMSSDIIKIEPFLKPGTFLLIDGRTLNVLFLKNFLYRNWDYKYFKNYDLHLFFLNGPTLGKLNDKQLKFYQIK